MISIEIVWCVFGEIFCFLPIFLNWQLGHPYISTVTMYLILAYIVNYAHMLPVGHSFLQWMPEYNAKQLLCMWLYMYNNLSIMPSILTSSLIWTSSVSSIFSLLHEIATLQAILNIFHTLASLLARVQF